MNRYQFLDREKQPETGYMDLVNRFYDPGIGRFMQVDPLAQDASDWTPYRYGFNNPIRYSDPEGLFESEEEARKYARENNIRTGWFSGNKIRQQGDGTYAINNKSAGTSISNDNEQGITTAALVTSKKNQPVSEQIMSATLGIAAITSQLDSPLPGPADAVAVGELAIGGLVAGLAYVTIDEIQFESYRNDTPPPKSLPGFPGAAKAKPKGGRARWVTPDVKILEWGSQHGEVEVYDKTGRNHQGAADPQTGEITKPPKPGRTTPK